MARRVMLLREVVARIQDIELTGDPMTGFEGIAYDSRLVKGGFLFVAIKGEKLDGTKFAGQALKNGASAVASEDCLSGNIAPSLKVPDARRFLAEISRLFYGDPSSRLELAAITGTNGKTTTSYLLESVFRHAGLRACLAGTIGNKIGDRTLPSSHTTPEASDLLSFLRQAAIEGCTHGGLEVSSHALALKRVYGVRFNVGVFMNLTQDHLDFHHDMESYYRAKRLLFVPEGGNRVECAVINLDDPYGRRLASEIACGRISFGFDARADIHVLEIESRIGRTNLRLATPQGELSLRSKLVGRPNIYNIMAAVGAASGLEIGHEAVRTGIENLPGVPGRLQLVDAGQPFTVVVDYAHTPDALESLLDTLKALSHGSLITVFGCGGDRDRKKRPIMGEIAGRKSDFVIATSDNPRTEDPAAILGEIEPGLRGAAACYSLIPDRREAIRKAIMMARKGDMVVIAGKGHENYQIIGTHSLPFEDSAVAREVILGRTDTEGRS